MIYRTNTEIKSSPSGRWFAAVAAALAFAMVMLATESPGPGLDPDSAAYLRAAESFAAGEGFRVADPSWDRADSTAALTFWPPGYSIAIASGVALGARAIKSARVVNAVAAAITFGTAGLLLFEAVEGIEAILGLLMIAATTAITSAHLSVLSEPLFLACCMAAMLAMAWAKNCTEKQLVVLAVIGAIAPMVRHAGGAVSAAVVLWALLESAGSLRRRFLHAGMVALPGACLIFAWFFRTARLVDRNGDITPSIYGGFGATLYEGWETLAEWVVPLLSPGLLRNALAVVALIAVLASIGRMLVASRRDGSTPDGLDLRVRVLRAAALLGVCYIAVIVASRLFVGGAIPFDWRILSPLILCLEVCVVVGVASWLDEQRRAKALVSFAVITLWLIAATAQTGSLVADGLTDGYDMASSDWRESELVAWTRHNAAEHTLYSNWPSAMYFHLHRSAHDVPGDLDLNDLEEFRRTMLEHRGYLVAFDTRQSDVASPDSIAMLCHFTSVAQLRDGTVWAPSERPCSR